jgi:sterol desaturase/sphingolipid hydroxylase (fatty acid hydroxylase superfamily)
MMEMDNKMKYAKSFLYAILAIVLTAILGLLILYLINWYPTVFGILAMFTFFWAIVHRELIGK